MTELKAGPELNALIAEKVMNTFPCPAWTIIQETIQGPIFTHIPNPRHEADQCYPRQYPPKYSSNIAAAWPVVEKLRCEESAFKLESVSDGEYQWWECTIYGHMEPADTAPLAICLAALKAVEGRV